MEPLRRRLLTLSTLAVMAASIASVTPVAAATPAGPAGFEPSDGGWAVVRDPSEGAYTPSARDRGNTSGGTVTVTRQETGRWVVRWVGLAGAGYGHVQVSALGSAPRHCAAYTWGTDGADATATIYCFKRTADALLDFGTPIDTPFVVTIVGEDAPVAGNPGRLAYAYTSDFDTDHTPDTSYDYVSTGGYLFVKHQAKGTYLVTIPGIGKADGAFLVNPYQSASELRRCQVRDWSLAGTDVQAHVDCVNLKGVTQDAEFNVLYLRRITLEGFGGKPGASLYANQPTTASYHPVAARDWSTAGKRSTVTRLSKGVYAVSLPGMPSGGAAIVSAAGPKTSPRACQIGSIRTDSAPQRVVVRCFTYAGKAADSRFVLAYTH